MAQDNNDQKTDHGKTLASWEFQEFKKYKRGKTWYAIAGIILAGLLAFGIFTYDYLLVVIIALFVIIYAMRARRQPAILTFYLMEDGLGIGQETFYEWKDIKNFWIVYEPPEVKNLYFDFKAGLRPSITISLENQNPLNIRKILLDYLPEDTTKENESFTDGLSRLLKL